MEKRKISAIEYMIAGLMGGTFYSLLEVVSRGYTHWSMTLTGGACAAIMYHAFSVSKRCVWIKCLWGSLIITALEFASGCIFNLWLDMKVWDYSDRPLNLMGQICLPFSVLWYALSFPMVWITDASVRRRPWIRAEKPEKA